MVDTRTTLLFLVLSAVCPPAGCFVLWNGERMQKLGIIADVEQLMSSVDPDDLGPPTFRWSAHPNVTNPEGLGLGITYAYDPDFFTTIMPKFKEGDGLINLYQFVSEGTVKRIIYSAFNTWAAHNPNIRFIDVTDICADNWYEPTEAQLPNNPVFTKVICDQAEVIISVFESEDGANEHAGAHVKPFYPTGRAPLSTVENSGLGGTVKRFTFEFAENKCWYIDASFCAWFYSMKVGGTDVVALMGAFFGIIFTGAFLVLFFGVFRIVKKVLYTMFKSFDTDQGGSVSLKEVMSALRNPNNAFKIDIWGAAFALIEVFANIQLINLMLVIFCFAFPPIFYFDVFIPCWECKDFEAAAVHEIGHIMGFDHPNNFADYNIKVDQEAYDCMNPLASARISKEDTDNESVMFGFMTHEPRSCLTQDDLDGLNFLYPVCHNRLKEPLCNKGGQNIGLLRLAQSVFSVELIPFCIFAWIKICCNVALMLRRKTMKTRNKIAAAMGDAVGRRPSNTPNNMEAGQQQNIPQPE